MSLLKIRQFSIDQTDTFTFANANVTANLFTGNANLGNLATANFFSGNGNALFNIQGANVVGTVANATLAVNVTASAQSNITSVGSLTGLTVSNATGIVDFTTTANVTLGAVANLHISGGTNGQVLRTDGSGTLSWYSMASGTGNANIAGSNTQLFFNNANSTTLGTSANLTFDSTTKTLTVDLISADGYKLSNVAGANVSGTVANANNSAYLGGTIASSYLLTTGTGSGLTAITGANVTGTVANANNASYLGGTSAASYLLTTGTGSGLTAITGANVTGAVAYATTANSVAGANVSGQVANANVSYYESVTTQTTGTFYPVFVSGNTTANYALASNTALSFNVATGVLTTGTIQSGGGSGGNITGANLISANYFSGSGNLLSNIQGANVSGAVSFATTANSVAGANVTGNVGNALNAYSVAGANVSGAVAYATTANSVAGANVSGQVGNALVAGTVYTNAQPNITSVGTLTSLTVSGDSTITGNLTVSGAFEYANVTSFRVKDPIIEQGGNTAGGALGSNDGYDRGQLLHYYSGSAIDAFMGWDNSNAEFGFGSNVSVTSEVVTWNSYGNVRASYFLGNGSQLTGVQASTAQKTANGTSNVDIATADGNITMAVGGTAGVVTITTTGVNIAGYANLGSGNLLTTGNVTAGYVIANGSSLSSITGANVTGNVGNALNAYAVAGANVSGAVSFATTANSVAGANVSGTVANATYAVSAGSATTAGTVTTASQPNITSVGTLTSLAVSGTTNLGAIGNVTITGGSANYFLKTDGAGVLSWSSLPSTTLSVDTYTGDGSWTMKTLSSTPLNINYTLVAIGGVFQPRSSYSLTGAVITFSDPPPNGAIVEITIINGGTAGSAGYVYQGINSSTTAIAGVRYLIDTTANVTLTLPSSASLGDEVGVIDATGNAGTKNITVARNGGKIEGASADLTVSTNRSAFTLVYYNSTQGWIKTQK